MTLVELLNVLVIMGILLMMAVPSYLGLKDRTYKAAAKSDLRNIVPAVVLYGTDNTPNSRNDPNADPTDVGYQGMSAALLQQKYDPTLDVSKYQVTGTPTTYCVYTWANAWTASQAGPGQPINVTLNSAFDPARCS